MRERKKSTGSGAVGMSATNGTRAFLSRTRTEIDWSKFLPIQKTLIVIDYVASRAAEVGEIAGHFIPHILRIHQAGANPAGGTREEFVVDEFLSRRKSSEVGEIVVAIRRSGGATGGVTSIQKSPKWFLHEDSDRDTEVAGEFLAQMYRYNRRGRPLFAMIVVICIYEAVEYRRGAAESVANSTHQGSQRIAVNCCPSRTH